MYFHVEVIAVPTQPVLSSLRNCAKPGRKYPDNALDFLIGTYSRTPHLAECIETLLAAGTTTRRRIPIVLDLLRHRVENIAQDQ